MKPKIPLHLLLLLLLSTLTHAVNKTLIMTQSYNRPDFIELQDKTFKKFLRDPYEFIVMNDANNPTMQKAIHDMCKKLKLRCINIPQQGRRPWASARTADAIKFSMSNMGFNHKGIVTIIDSDMFLIKPFSITKYLNKNDIVGLFQTTPSNNKISYLWNGLLFMNMKTLPNRKTMNFSDGFIDGHWGDTGLMLHHYFKRNKSVRVQYYREDHIETLPHNIFELTKMGYDDITADFIISYQDFKDPYNMQFHAEGNFLHYRAGGNWQKASDDYHTLKTQYLVNYINRITQN